MNSPRAFSGRGHNREPLVLDSDFVPRTRGSLRYGLAWKWRLCQHRRESGFTLESRETECLVISASRDLQREGIGFAEGSWGEDLQLPRLSEPRITRVGRETGLSKPVSTWTICWISHGSNSGSDISIAKHSEEKESIGILRDPIITSVFKTSFILSKSN